jgi:hypothetical protein
VKIPSIKFLKNGVQAQSTLSPPLLPSPLHSDIPEEPADNHS